MSFTSNRGALWLDSSLNPIVTANPYQLVIFTAFAETSGFEVGGSTSILQAPDDFVVSSWLRPPDDFNDGESDLPVVWTEGDSFLFDGTASIPNTPLDGAYVLIGGYFTAAGDKTFEVTFETASSSPVALSATLVVGATTTDPTSQPCEEPTVFPSAPNGALQYLIYETSVTNISSVTARFTCMTPMNGVEETFLQFYEADLGFGHQYFGIQTDATYGGGTASQQLLIFSKFIPPSDVRTGSPTEVRIYGTGGYSSGAEGAQYVSLRRPVAIPVGVEQTVEVRRMESQSLTLNSTTRVGDWYDYYFNGQPIGGIWFERLSSTTPAVFDGSGGSAWTEYWKNNGVVLYPVPEQRFLVRPLKFNDQYGYTTVVSSYSPMPNSDTSYVPGNGPYNGYFDLKLGGDTERCHIDDAVIDVTTSVSGGGGPRSVQVDLFTRDDPPSLLYSNVEVLEGGYWTEEDSDAGAAEITIPDLALSAAVAAEDQLVRFYVDGAADRTAIVEKARVVVRSVNPTNRRITLTGRDWLAEFDDALVNPPKGLSSRPQVQSVRFDWTHPDLPIPQSGPPGVQWIRPYNMGALYKGNKNAINQDVQPWQNGKLGQAPRGWPDSFTGWMWERPYGLPGAPANSHPVMTAWFDLLLYFDTTANISANNLVNQIGVDRAVADRPFIMVFTADDVGELAFDGAVVDSGVTPPAIQWQRCNSVVIPDVSEGWHHIRIKATNRPYDSFGGAYNVGSVAFCAFQPVRDIRRPAEAVTPSLQNSYDPVGNLIVRTATTSIDPLFSTAAVNQQIAPPYTSGGNDLRLDRGGGWFCIGGVHANNDPDQGFTDGFQPPGFTVGHAFKLLFEDAQAQGHLEGWTLGFTEFVDSAGNGWPRTTELTAKVSDTLLSVIRAWHDEGHWDVAAQPGSRVLDAWIWQARGNYNTITVNDALTWTDDQLSELSIESER